MDELTRLSNRRGFESLSGHAEGDRALISFSTILAENFRESDVIGRLGGDEFAVFLTNTTAAERATVLAHFEAAVNTYNRASKRGYDL